MRKLRNNKNGIMYGIDDKTNNVTFWFYAGGFGTLYLTETMERVTQVLNKSIEEVDYDDLIIHPYAEFDDNEYGFKGLLNGRDSIEDLEDSSPWVAAMTKEEKKKWKQKARRYE